MHRAEPSPEDTIAGVAPRVAFEPESVGECTDALRAARSERLAVAVVGGRTELGLGGRPTRLDAVVSSRKLDRVVEYAPSDQVVVVEAGVRLAELQRVLGERGQRLACDPPHADRATLGGLLATNAFGPLRTRYGSLRDLLIGVSLVRADGTLARAGGKVVKNVAGFDLPKLVVGSLGTLGMIALATFRLHPQPETEGTLMARGLSPAVVRAIAVAFRDAQLEPAAMVAIGRTGPYGLLVRFEGFASSVAEQCSRARELLAAQGHPPEVLAAADAAVAWDGHDAIRTRGSVAVKVSAVPAALERLVSGVVAPLSERLSGAATVLYPTLGLGFVTGDAEDGATLAAALSAARAGIPDGQGSVVVHALPPDHRSAVDVWGPAPAAISLMKRVKDRFDPEQRMNPGRFVGGL